MGLLGGRMIARSILWQEARLLDEDEKRRYVLVPYSFEEAAAEISVNRASVDLAW
jgi:hypothetical protein